MGTVGKNLLSLIPVSKMLIFSSAHKPTTAVLAIPCQSFSQTYLNAVRAQRRPHCHFHVGSQSSLLLRKRGKQWKTSRGAVFCLGKRFNSLWSVLYSTFSSVSHCLLFQLRALILSRLVPLKPWKNPATAVCPSWHGFQVQADLKSFLLFCSSYTLDRDSLRSSWCIVGLSNREKRASGQ